MTIRFPNATDTYHAAIVMVFILFGACKVGRGQNENIIINYDIMKSATST